MTAHGRLPWFAPDELDADARALYDTITGGQRTQDWRAFPLTSGDGRLNGPFNAMLLSPDIGTAMQELGAAIRFRSSLPARTRELAILEVAAIRRCSFEWYAHERIGERAGLTVPEIGALRDGAPAPTFDAAEALARELVRTLMRDRDLDDATYARARDTLGERTLMELIALVGYYDLLALGLRVWRTPLPPGAEPVF